MLAGGQIAITRWVLCEKLPLEAHPGLAGQGGLFDDEVASTSLGEPYSYPSGVPPPLEIAARNQR
jgi:hypothetical protein